MVTKKKWLILLSGAFILSTLLSYIFFSPQNKLSFFPTKSDYGKPGSAGKTTAEDTEPKTEPCPLNGQLYSKTQKTKWEKRRPLGIMVENHTDARPQSGISYADVVYEAVAEGGITRFLSIFYCQDAPRVGPVRSARIYFVRLLQGYGDYPLYGHVGGANAEGPADALGFIERMGWAQYSDLNQFSVPFPNYWRDYEVLPNRATEHTVYTTTGKLWEFAKTKRNLTNVDKKGAAWNKDFTPWKFKDDAGVADRGNGTKISFAFWNFFANEYAVSWTYDKTANSYRRENGGTPHLDKNNGKQLTAKDVVVIFAKESPANDGYPGGHILYKLVGSGDALVFQDGKSVSATWKKPDPESMVSFYDDAGKEISLVRGQVFVEILPTGNKVTY
ncbi:DUF3048 domain-containing protein [Candidatus Roizmanbacteria bacterium]|nr:DUF3048 domain-containing protein [Candidatus Roizmanbacteria bacterium]